MFIATTPCPGYTPPHPPNPPRLPLCVVLANSDFFSAGATVWERASSVARGVLKSQPSNRSGRPSSDSVASAWRSLHSTSVEFSHCPPFLKQPIARERNRCYTPFHTTAADTHRYARPHPPNATPPHREENATRQHSAPQTGLRAAARATRRRRRGQTSPPQASIACGKWPTPGTALAASGWQPGGATPAR